VYDPEISVNIYDLGLVYSIEIIEKTNVTVTMTLTAPACPVADEIVRETEEKIRGVEGVTSAEVKLVFDPPWTKDMMSEEARLELGFM
jgi:FeS assembly SUF system protein